MVNVVCVKWGKRYSAHWVLRLKAMVEKHLSFTHRFVCLTDDPVPGVECIPFATDLVGWWAKIELFRPDLFTGSTLYFDLDVVLTASVDGIVLQAASDPSRLWMRDDFSYSLVKPRTDLDPSARRLLGGPGCCNSSVMAWHGDNVRIIWDAFDRKVMDEMHGDQNYISRLLYPDKLGFLENAFVDSYKYRIRAGRPMAPVMVFHGSPKMDELPRGDSLRAIWEAAA